MDNEKKLELKYFAIQTAVTTGVVLGVVVSFVLVAAALISFLDFVYG